MNCIVYLEEEKELCSIYKSHLTVTLKITTTITTKTQQNTQYTAMSVCSSAVRGTHFGMNARPLAKGIFIMSARTAPAPRMRQPQYIGVREAQVELRCAVKLCLSCPLGSLRETAGSQTE